MVWLMVAESCYFNSSFSEACVLGRGVRVKLFSCEGIGL